MIMTVDELKQFIETDDSDAVLKARLQAIELAVRSYTNNNFMVRSIRNVAVVNSPNTLVINGAVPFRTGDTLQITESEFQQNMLVTILKIQGSTIFVDADLTTGEKVVITKISYPQDVKMGIVNLIKWELGNREKVGIQSETISRHSVTYYNMDSGNTIMGFPASLVGFLRPYKKARFGGGIK